MQRLPIPQDVRISAALRYIEDNLGEHITVASAAEVAGLSTFYFSRFFQRHIAETATSYIRRRRMESAARRLAWTMDPIATIAADLAYADQASFTRAFTAHVGSSPGSYRNDAGHSSARTGGDHTTGDRVRFERRVAMQCIAQRFVGPPAEIPAFWESFARQLRSCVEFHPNVFVGLRAYPDLPSSNSALHYDCACPIPPGNEAAMPSLRRAGFENVVTRPGIYATLCHRKGRDNCVRDTFDTIFSVIRGTAGRITFLDGPGLEIYRGTSVPRSNARDFEVAVPVADPRV